MKFCSISRIHPEYTDEPSEKNDVALIKLSLRIDFIENEISPICLPHNRFRDIPRNDKKSFRAFVAGWGMTASEESSGSKYSCTTNNFGPSPNTPCSTFIFDDKMHDKGCTKSRSPTSQHFVCKNFRKWARNNDLELWDDNYDKSYRIVYWKSSSRKYTRGQYQSVTCYNPSSGNYGWCGTCYDVGYNSTKIGDPGFCSSDGTGQAMIEYVREKLSRMHVIYCSYLSILYQIYYTD